MASKIKVGDNVAYSVQFLRSCYGGQAPVCEEAQLRGVVKELTRYGGDGGLEIATIDWTGNVDEAQTKKVATANLAKVGPNVRFCAC